MPGLLLAVEGALAFVAEPAEAASAGIDRLHRYSEVYGWEPRPGRYVDSGRTVTINDATYRGAALPGRRESGRTRVVVLGDSVAFGLYVGDDETYAARLAARGPHLEVANLAVQGYGPGQSLLRLERIGLQLEPDVVVLALCLGNDFADAMLPAFLYDEAHPTPYFREEQGRLVRYDAHLKLELRDRLSMWLLENSRLFRAIGPRPAAQDGRDEAPWTKRRGEAMRDRGATVDLVGRLVVEARDRARSQSARFLVLLHPDRVGGARSTGTWERALVDRLDVAGVESLSLAAAYEERGLAYEQVAIDAIGHLSAQGHEVTAAILEQRLGLSARQAGGLTDTASLQPR